jgi:RHS repeat-associated protein
LLEENDNGAVTDYLYANGRPIGTYVPSTGKVYFIQTDHLGTPQVVTDSTQKTVWKTTYQPFGTTGMVTASTTQNLRFPGQYADTETGFSYNSYRDYMPNIGRYLEADPIGIAGGFNNYLYVTGNPNGFIDPLGTDMLSWIANTTQSHAVDSTYEFGISQALQAVGAPKEYSDQTAHFCVVAFNSANELEHFTWGGFIMNVAYDLGKDKLKDDIKQNPQVQSLGRSIWQDIQNTSASTSNSVQQWIDGTFIGTIKRALTQ